MNRFPSRKVIILAVILLVITLGVLWYVGKKNRQEREAKKTEIMSELIKKNQNLRSVVESNLEEKGGLQKFDPTSLFKEEEIKINTLSSVTASDLKNYAENLAEIFKPLAKKRDNEVQIMLTALDNGDRTLTKEIVSARLAFDQIAIDLSKTSAPAEIANLQQNLLVSVKKLSLLASQMEKVIDEPVLALQSGKTYLSEADNLVGLINSLNDYLQKTGVVGKEDKIVVTFSKE